MFDSNTKYTRIMNRIIRKGAKRINNMFCERRIREYNDIFSHDWANLIILDGCRYDKYKELNNLSQGELNKVVSNSSWTPGFLKKNFENADLSDTVYITANPIYAVDRWLEVDISSSFYKIIDIWKESWDQSINTVHPHTMAEKSLKLCSRFPNKRLIFHFIQPHIPFIGEKGSNINQAGMRSRDIAVDGKFKGDNPQVWELARRGKLSHEQLVKGYEENLNIVLPYIEKMIKKLDYTTIITSDHGNHMGEIQRPIPIRHYGHPPDVVTPTLREVPWHVIESKDSKRITKGKIQTHQPSQASIEEKLHNLGYNMT